MANPAANIAMNKASRDEPRSPLEPGQILEGKFRIERIIGEGAMGLVVEATHLELEERVALKFLREEARKRPDVAARFQREARASSKIKNDHVARVYDVGTHEGTPFIVMEFLEGRDLEQLLEQDGALDATTAVDYIIQACEGLTAAHVQGIVHRDIKPGNLFLTEHGGIKDIKVLDFGISKSGVKRGGTLDDIEVQSGETTQIMGSPHYMSPEQIRSTKDVDARADLWSLGVVLHELLTGEPAFDGSDVTGLIAQVLHEPHRPVRSLAPHVPVGLAEVVDRCLEKDAAKRYATPADLAVALLPFAPKRSRAVAERAMTMVQRATGQQVAFDSLPPPSSASGPVSTTRSTNASLPAFVPQAAPSQVPPPSRGMTPWIALVAIVLGLGGGAFAVLSRMGSPKTPPQAEPTLPVATTEKAPEKVLEKPPEKAPENTPDTVAAVASEKAVPSAAPPSTTPPATAVAGAIPTAAVPPVAAVPVVKQAQPVFVPPPPRPKTPSSSTVAPPPSGENEIRRER